MQTILKKYHFIILSIFLMAGVLIAAWAFDFHLENQAKSAEFQIDLKNETQGANVNDIILVLVCVGLIGLFGVRRKSKSLQNYVEVKHPERKARACFFNENGPEGLNRSGC